MGYVKIDKIDTDCEDLEKVFAKIENSKDFKTWFGTPCPDFNPLCANCTFWLRWNKLKNETFREYFR